MYQIWDKKKSAKRGSGLGTFEKAVEFSRSSRVCCRALCAVGATCQITNKVNSNQSSATVSESTITGEVRRRARVPSHVDGPQRISPMGRRLHLIDVAGENRSEGEGGRGDRLRDVVAESQSGSDFHQPAKQSVKATN